MVIDRFNGDDESYILYLLEVYKRISNKQLCQELNLSTSTVRKKLAKMEEKGLLIRTHGGAASTDADRDETFAKKLRINMPHKKAIASLATRFIREGETISLGGGSTVAELSPYLLRMNRSVILTNSTVLASQIASNRKLEIHINSGIVRGRTGCVVGPSSELLFNSYQADKAFVGCDAFNLHIGAGSDNILVGRVERCMLEHAKERYILCDSTKLNQEGLFKCADLREITALFTDEEANPDYIEQLRANGLTVYIAPIPRPSHGTASIFDIKTP